VVRQRGRINIASLLQKFDELMFAAAAISTMVVANEKPHRNNTVSTLSIVEIDDG
jgi:hypothetical protein